MSTTIGKLIDRVYREYLEPADNVESFSILSGSMTDSVTKVNVGSDESGGDCSGS